MIKSIARSNIRFKLVVSLLAIVLLAGVLSIIVGRRLRHREDQPGLDERALPGGDRQPLPDPPIHGPDARDRPGGGRPRPGLPVREARPDQARVRLRHRRRRQRRRDHARPGQQLRGLRRQHDRLPDRPGGPEDPRPHRRHRPARLRGHRPRGRRPGLADGHPRHPDLARPAPLGAGRGPGPDHQDRRAHPRRRPAGRHPLRGRPAQQQRRLRRPLQAPRLQGREDQRQGRRDDDPVPGRRPGGHQRPRPDGQTGHRDPGLRGGLPQGLRARRDLGRQGLRRRRLVPRRSTTSTRRSWACSTSAS